MSSVAMTQQAPQWHSWERLGVAGTEAANGGGAVESIGADEASPQKRHRRKRRTASSTGSSLAV